MIENTTSDKAEFAAGTPTQHGITKSELAELATRIIALWLFAQVAATLTSLVVAVLAVLTMRSPTESLEMIISGGILPLGILVIGLLLWFNARAIGARLVSTDGEPIVFAGFSAADVLSIVFAAMGVYIIVSALPALARPIITAVISSVPFNDVWSQFFVQREFWLAIVQIAIGIWFIVGSRGIARLVRSLQRKEVRDEDGLETTAKGA